jgi:tetratricopeptide (TPR) repeat protein
MDEMNMQSPAEKGFLSEPSERFLGSGDHGLRLNHGEIAGSLLARGQMCLLKGDLYHGLELFDSAIKLDSQNPKLFYSQGLSLFEYGSEEGREKALHLAGKKLKAATAIAPQYFEAWQAWGSVLCTLGLAFREHHYFQEAEEKLKVAKSLSAGQQPDALADLNWDLGIVYSHLAENSGEALDLHQAIEAFQDAALHHQYLSSDFWKDFGRASLKFASQISDIRFYIKAINCFKQAVSLDSSDAESWALLAKSLQKLYEITHDEDHFSQANECFASATQIQPNDANLWLAWAKFLCDSTRRSPEAKQLRACIEKCHRAYAIEPDQPMVQAVWAEALAYLGETCERVDLIFDAHNKIVDAIENASEQPEIWFSYGMCLLAMARYFNDEDHYYQAIEKFQSGISTDRTYHANWHAIALTYAKLGKEHHDMEMLVKALRFYQRALDLQTSSYYIIDYAIALSKIGEMNHDQKHLDYAVAQFERAISMQRNALYAHPNWLYHYACTLDALGDFHDEDFYYLRAIEILTHVLMIDPDFHEVHHRLALTLSHLGELTEEVDHFFRAIHHYRLSLRHNEENDLVILDWAITLINLAQHCHDSTEANQFYQDAEHKLVAAAKLGNLQSSYHLSCLHSLLGNYETAMFYLRKANEAEALPPIDEMLSDEWLDGLRSTEDFREFLAYLEHRPNLPGER